jgi:tetratricopeptide (TPR) repeat protein
VKNPFLNLFPNNSLRPAGSGEGAAAVAKGGRGAAEMLRSATGGGVGASLGKLDTEPLEFEAELTNSDYKEYCALIGKIQSNPNDIRLILDLAEFFLAIFLHKEGLVCLTRVLDLCMLRPLPMNEFAKINLMVAKLSARYLGDYRLLGILKDTVESCPDYPPVLCQAARLYDIIRCDEAAEQLYIGAMLLDPNYAPALEGYASLLLRQGHVSTAVRYLNRIEATYHGYAVARLRLGWSHEVLGSEPEVILLVYHSIVGLSARNRPTVLTLSALGHFHHVRGDMDKALDYYKRGLMYDPNDVSCLILSACACASAIIPGTYTKEIAQPAIRSVDSKFRRGVFFNQKNSSRWIALLSFAEFLMCCKKDSHTAEDVLWESCR